jgi:hypothetical protein
MGNITLEVEVGAEVRDKGCGLCSYLKGTEGPVLRGIDGCRAKHRMTADGSGRSDSATARNNEPDHDRTRDMGHASDCGIKRLWAGENERGDIRRRQITEEIARGVLILVQKSSGR